MDCTQQYVLEPLSSCEQKLLLENAGLRKKLGQTIFNYEQKMRLMEEEHLQDLHQQEQCLRNELKARFQTIIFDYESKCQLYLEREMARQNTLHKSEMDILALKYQHKFKDLEDKIKGLREEVQKLREKLKSKENKESNATDNVE